jgi:predicted nucleic acid-binding Zn ribbon protein
MADEIPARLGDLLEPAARRAGIEDGARTGMVWSKWRSIVGPDIALHAEPSSLRGRILRIRADSPAWATELGYLGDEIRRRTNELVGVPLVDEVRVWTGPGRIRSTPDAPSGQLPAGSDDTPGGVDPATAFERAFSAWRKRRRGASGDRLGRPRRDPAKPAEDG